MSAVSSAQYIVNFTVTQSELLVADAGLNQGVTIGTTLQLGGQPSATGGTPPYTYLWSPTHGLSDPTEPNPTITADSSLAYTLIVTDSDGCTAESTKNISIIIGVTELSDPPESFVVFPNPVTGGIIRFRSATQGESEFDLIIRGLTGQELFRTKFSGDVYELSASEARLGSGLYLVTIRGAREHHFKIVLL